MELIIGKTAGFCFGVANAVNKTYKLLDEKNNLFCLGELVHNKQVTDELKSNGLNIVDEIDEANSNVIIRSHGVKKDIYKIAENKGINVFDLTCPKVLKIHNIVLEYAQKNYYILLIGKKDHPEVIATLSYCGNNAGIIEDKEQMQDELEKFTNSNIKKLLIVAQTTISLKKYEEIISLIKRNVKDDILIEIKNTICDATRIRQEETEKIARQVDMMIIIGGKHSSNTNKLYDIAKKYCKDSVLAETKDEINLNNVCKYNKIGIMAGASTPKKSIDSVVEMLNKI